MQDRHHALSGLVEVFAQAVLQEGVFHRRGRLCHADALAEVADGHGRVAAAAQAAEGRHPGVVPAGDLALLDELAQLTLGHDRMVDAQTGELDLAGLRGQGAVLHDPVVQGTVGLKFQGAEGVGNVLHRVLDGMGKVIHGIDAPLVAGGVVRHVVDAVDRRVPHIKVAGGQVDLRAEGHRAVWELARLHPAEEVQALLHGAVAVGRAGRSRQIAAVFTHLLRGQLADVGQTLPDQLLGAFVHLVEILGGVVEAVAPVEAEPVDILLDGLHVLNVFLRGVGVVHAEVAQAAELLRRAEVDAKSLAVADVQITVGLRREAGVDGHAGVLSALGNILLNESVDKILVFVVPDFFCHGFILTELKMILYDTTILPELQDKIGKTDKNSDPCAKTPACS